MSCYRPLLAEWTGNYTEKGKREYKINGFTRYKGPGSLKPGDIPIPCGKCLGCRLDYSRQWADRMMLELETAGKGIFVTLTYNDEHVPCMYDEDTGEFIGMTVSKRDCQLFMKRLRKQFDGVTVRFFLSSEYGPLHGRPHYHAIIFGIGLDDLPEKSLRGKNEIGQLFFVSPEIERAWQNGFVLVSDVSWNTCSYVARYVLKKAMADQLSGEEMGVAPEFSLMSRRPGIGSRYMELHPEMFDYQYVSLSTGDGSKKIYIPSYFLRKLELIDKEKFDKIKEQRIAAAQDRELLKMHESTVSFLDQLEIDEMAKARQLAALKRTVG